MQRKHNNQRRGENNGNERISLAELKYRAEAAVNISAVKGVEKSVSSSYRNERIYFLFITLYTPDMGSEHPEVFITLKEEHY